MGTDDVKTALPFYHCGEAYSDKTPVQDGFVSYRFRTGEVIGLAAETILVKKRVRGGDDKSTSLTLPALPVYFRSDVSQIALQSIRSHSDKYRRLADSSDAARQNRLLKASI